MVTDALHGSRCPRYAPHSKCTYFLDESRLKHCFHPGIDSTVERGSVHIEHKVEEAVGGAALPRRRIVKRDFIAARKIVLKRTEDPLLIVRMNLRRSFRVDPGEFRVERRHPLAGSSRR